MLSFSEVTKRYGATVALDGLTMTVPQGAIFGLLGPNAAGKSTLIKLVMSFIFPDRGRIDRGGWSPCEIGYVPETMQFPPRAPIGEYLTTVGRLAGMSGDGLQRAVERRLEQVEMSHARGLRFNACSRGMLQRLALAAALLADPPFLLLDEPMNGLDPAGQKDLRRLIQQLRVENKTVLFSTHQLGDVVQVCTHVGILNRGRLVRCGSLAEVLPLRPQVTIVADRLPGPACRQITALDPSIEVNGNTITLEGRAVDYRRTVVQILIEAGSDIQHLEQARMTLEEVYLEALRR